MTFLILSHSSSTRFASNLTHLKLAQFMLTKSSHCFNLAIFVVGTPGLIIFNSSSFGDTVICNAVGLTRNDSLTMRSAAISRCCVYPPTRFTTTSALANVSSCQPTQSCPTISSKSPPSQSRSLIPGCDSRNPWPSHPKSPDARLGAPARKALRQRMVTSWPSLARAEERVAPMVPVPPGITMLKPWATDERSITTATNCISIDLKAIFVGSMLICCDR
mmetsp:Transcript_14249/g.23242  ORF Transcript_14249/g.23242 Transcript_14249/m.23242 type:complete len:219 (+) Transcript_14249:285-941(+)